MRFYLGTHHPHWLGRTDVPLFISHRRLRERRSFPRALGRWALDSGAFTEISTYGEWRTSEVEYVEAVLHYQQEIGLMDFAAPQDWMCEPEMIERTGLSVEEHQHLTIENYLILESIWLAMGEGPSPFIPVLQGWTYDDYGRHLEAYDKAGVDLRCKPLTGVGSVCRRQATLEIAEIMRTLSEEGVKTHGFGVKKSGYGLYARYMASADSMAWSYNARKHPPLPGHTHASCANCMEWAMRWRDDLLGQTISPHEQMRLAA